MSGLPVLAQENHAKNHDHRNRRRFARELARCTARFRRCSNGCSARRIPRQVLHSPADGRRTLPDPAGLEAILLTGSPAGVYDDLDWIAPLERFVRAAYHAKIPMAGICFGHQLIAQALGGTVRKSEKGWGIGRHVYDVVPGNG